MNSKKIRTLEKLYDNLKKNIYFTGFESATHVPECGPINQPIFSKKGIPLFSNHFNHFLMQVKKKIILERKKKIEDLISPSTNLSSSQLFSLIQHQHQNSKIFEISTERFQKSNFFLSNFYIPLPILLATNKMEIQLDRVWDQQNILFLCGEKGAGKVFFFFFFFFFTHFFFFFFFGAL